jgi:hypothetical protein
LVRTTGCAEAVILDDGVVDGDTAAPLAETEEALPRKINVDKLPLARPKKDGADEVRVCDFGVLNVVAGPGGGDKTALLATDSVNSPGAVAKGVATASSLSVTFSTAGFTLRGKIRIRVKKNIQTSWHMTNGVTARTPSVAFGRSGLANITASNSSHVKFSSAADGVSSCKRNSKISSHP